MYLSIWRGSGQAPGHNVKSPPGKTEDLDSKSVSDTKGFYELGEAFQFPLTGPWEE